LEIRISIIFQDAEVELIELLHLVIFQLV
jgi:hypothetical protein